MEEKMMLAAMPCSYGRHLVKAPRGMKVFAIDFVDPNIILCLRAPVDTPEVEHPFYILGQGHKSSEVGRYVDKLVLRREVPIPPGIIIPAGVDAKNARAVESMYFYVFEPLAPTLQQQTADRTVAVRHAESQP